jgi:FdhD protein
LTATPDDLEDFALGFSYTEGIITARAEIADLAVISVADGIVLRMWLTGDRADAFAARRRRFVGPAGCGMCGLESLAEANRTIPMASYGSQVSRQDIAEAVAALPARQHLNMQTRAVHAAAFWRPDQGLVLREDVGRHNALHKLAGALLRTGWLAAEGVIALSSRISIELMQKAGMTGAAIVVGVSAPTALGLTRDETRRRAMLSAVAPIWDGWFSPFAVLCGVGLCLGYALLVLVGSSRNVKPMFAMRPIT